MFWKKKAPPSSLRPEAPEPEGEDEQQPVSKSEGERLDEAAATLGAALNAYSDAAYRALKSEPDPELVTARGKVAAANKLVREGRIAYALGRCIPDHVKYWPSWSKRDDFQNWVGFEATEITATEREERDEYRTSKAAIVEFTFRDTRYKLILRDLGMSMAPGAMDRHGEVELFSGEQRVAKFDLIEDISKEYSCWEFSDVRALKVGPWMKDILDIASQIDHSRQERMDDVLNERTLEAGREIDLG
jgi:hypothetical protein